MMKNIGFVPNDGCWIRKPWQRIECGCDVTATNQTLVGDGKRTLCLHHSKQYDNFRAVNSNADLMGANDANLYTQI